MGMVKRGTRYWVGVASHAHVIIGIQGGFAQVCHGKEGPLRRMQEGDWLVYYSPRTQMNGGTLVQAFTAIGRIADDLVYSHPMQEGFVPFRRDVQYLPCQSAPIQPFLDRLSFIQNKARWGYPFRFGLFAIQEEDFLTISAAMGAAVWEAEGCADV